MSHHPSSNRGRQAPAGSSSGHASRSGLSSSSRTAPTTNCRHYERNCNMVAPCCGAVVCCHRGHDEARKCSHKMDLSAVRTLVCCSCKQKQAVGKACRSCSRLFGAKGCIPCRMWYSGDGFHCAQCGVCRQGSEKDMVHCKSCRMCYPVRSGPFAHTCAPTAAGSRSCSRDCVGCGKDTHRSRRPSTTMSCGHIMHCDCFLARVKVDYSCPDRACRKTVGNMVDWNKALDRMAQAEAKVNPAGANVVYCFDCRRPSTVRTGGNLKKCRSPKCGSFNTVRIPPSQQSAPFVLPPQRIPRG